MVKTANLAIVFIDLKGYTAKTMELSRKAHEDHLNQYKSLVLPVAKAFNGKLIKGIGDAFLLTFTSPTDSVLFGKAVQDCLWNYNKNLDQSDKIETRVAINVGEVRLEKGDIYGEAVNIAARVESLGEAGEIFLTDAVYLSMNKAEVETEPVGNFDLKGIPKPVLIHKTVRINDSEDLPPYDSKTLEYKSTQLPKIDTEKALIVVDRTKSVINYLITSLLSIYRKSPIIKVVFLLLIGSFSVQALFFSGNSYPKVESLLKAGKPKKALQLLKKDPDKEDGNWLFLKGRAYAQLKDKKRMLNFYTLSLENGADDRYISTIIKDTFPELQRKNSEHTILLYKKYIKDDATKTLLSATTAKKYWLRWNAIDILKHIGDDSDIDWEQVYIADLKHSSNCTIRKKAAIKLGEIGGEESLKVLQDEDKDINFLINMCMGSTLSDSAEKIENR